MQNYLCFLSYCDQDTSIQLCSSATLIASLLAKSAYGVLLRSWQSPWNICSIQAPFVWSTLMSLTHRKSRKRYQRALLQMEALEPRTLLSATPQFYTVDNVTPVVGAYDAGGNLWVVNANTASLDQVAPNGTTGTGSMLASIDLSNVGFINRMTLGPDGHFYLADDN